MQSPTTGGVVTSSHVATVSTNAMRGYKLTLSSKTNNTDLINTTDGTAKLTASAGTLANPIALVNNAWGYSVSTTRPAKYTGIKSNASPDTIATTNAPTAQAGSKHTIYYGVRLDKPATTKSGNYQATVVYTAVAQLPPKPIITGVNPMNYTVFNNQIGAGDQGILTITGQNLDSAYNVFVDFNTNGQPDSNEYCVNPTVAAGKVTCTLPSYSGKTSSHKIYLTSQAQSTPILVTDQFTYINGICRNGDSASACQVDIDRNGMFPVKYDETKKSWVIADINKAGDWYDYGQHKWANAVTVQSSKLATYQSATAGTTINNADILGYWVYVPRYSYEVQRPNATDKFVAANNFTIAFEKTSDIKKTPATSCNKTNMSATDMWLDGKQNNIANNIKAKDYRTGCGLDRSYPTTTAKAGKTTWATHPAFTFGNTELNGMWVGKFELTGSRAKPTVLPNQQANVTETVGSFNDIIKAMGAKDANNTAGNGAVYTQNTHNVSAKSNMIKNDQWGAAAYLSASLYGAGVNKVYNNAATVYYTVDSSGIYHMNKDGDGNNAGHCYYPKKRYNANTSKIETVNTSIGCFMDSKNNFVSDNGVKLSKGQTVNYTYQDASGKDVAATATVVSVYGSMTGCGPYNASGSTSLYEQCDDAHSYTGSIGQLASTTNNVYGIYDMAAGVWEYTATNLTSKDNVSESNTAYMKNPLNNIYGTLYRTADGFDRVTPESGNGVGKAPAWSVPYGGYGSTQERPWLSYLYNNDFCAWQTCGGQAMIETKSYQSNANSNYSWGSDYSLFPNVTYPWVLRGGLASNGRSAGVFAFVRSSGGASVSYGSRAVLLAR